MKRRAFASSGASIAAALALAAAATAVQAQTLEQSQAALKRRDYAAAIAALEPLAQVGDIQAKGRLADLLLNAPAPHKDFSRGCTLAREGGEAGDALAQAAVAQCLVATGDPRALPKAREIARMSMAQGEAAGAYMLYVAFIVDPANSYVRDGKADMAAYEALAARPLEARTEQSEAFDALAFAATRGHTTAAVSLATYLYETVAPRNVLRLREVIGALLKSGEKSAPLLEFQQRAGQVVTAGNTHASVRAFVDAYRVALAWAQAIDATATKSKPCGEIRLLELVPHDLVDPVFLPQKNADMQQTYLVNGTWDETWKFGGCGRESRVQVHFTADGWGGARFEVRALAAQPAH